VAPPDSFATQPVYVHVDDDPLEPDVSAPVQEADHPGEAQTYAEAAPTYEEPQQIPPAADPPVEYEPAVELTQDTTTEVVADTPLESDPPPPLVVATEPEVPVETVAEPPTLETEPPAEVVEADYPVQVQDEEEARYVGSDRANRYYSYKGDALERMVDCYECGKTHNIIKEATSALCPSCGAYIALKDYDIDSTWTSTIQTRGDVYVGKRGKISSVTIYCHDLTVDGEVDATIDCSGDLHINNDCNITGRVRCMKLTVAAGVNVTFKLNVDAVEVVNFGHIVGNFNHTEKMSLHKKSVLEGNISTTIFELNQGAVHQGMASIGQV